MQKLGHTRSSLKPAHLLQTADTFVRASLPGAAGVDVITHAAPAMGANFAQYTLEFAPQGHLWPATVQRFLYVLEGELTVTLAADTRTLAPGGYAYLPEGTEHQATAVGAARAVLIEKPYKPLANTPPPAPLFGQESDVTAEPLDGDEDLRVRHLLPDEVAFDFAVNTMTYQPGAALSMIEIHVMQHGLLMLEGGGIYRLEDAWYPVTAGDFIWMGPYCPQWFGALGKKPAKYLIFKDWNRSPFA